MSHVATFAPHPFPEKDTDGNPIPRSIAIHKFKAAIRANATIALPDTPHGIVGYFMSAEEYRALTGSTKNINH
jgi:hypothetical protein